MKLHHLLVMSLVLFGVLNTQAFLFDKPLNFEDIQWMSLSDLIGQKLTIINNFLNQMCKPLPSWLQGSDPAADQIRFKFFRKCSNVSEPVTRSRRLLTKLNSTKFTWIHFHGFGSDIVSSSDIYTIWQQLACRTDEFNFIAVDLSNYMKSSYIKAVFNIQSIANSVAEGIRQLYNAPSRKIQANRIIMSGHSLGAHTAGLTARCFNQLTGRRIKRIIALDPASPCLDTATSNITLSSTDAEIVDVIHGNNGLLGIRRPIGTSDFYPDGVGMFPGGSTNARGAHDLPVKLLAESIVKRNSLNFPSYKCGSLNAMQQGRCMKQSGNQMGYSAKSNMRGIFFVPINKKAPFGKGAGKSRANWLSNKCHMCQP